jgi:hypothetical protein
VTNADVAPTVLRFFGLKVPGEMDGQAIRTVPASPAPFDLHRRHLEQRRIRFPIGVGVIALVSLLGILAVATLAVASVRGRVPGRVGVSMRFLALCGAALPIPLMLGGLLPRFTYAVVVPFLVVLTVLLALLALLGRWPGPLGPFFLLGALGLAVLVFDCLLGWRALRIPLAGGTMFDGVRFYGIPNAFIGLLLASALFVAMRLPVLPGTAVLFAAGLFGGLPGLGTNVGASIPLFVAAGLWPVLRTRGRVGLREVIEVGAVVLVGTAVVLAANRYLPGSPTHLTRYVQRTGGDASSALGTIRRRAGVTFGQIAQTPAVLIPLLGLPVVLGVVLASRGAIARGLAVEAGWRHVLIAVVAASIVAFVVNDTGAAAASPGFLYSMAGLTYAVCLSAGRPRRVAEEAPSDRARASRPVAGANGRRSGGPVECDE